MVNLVRRSLILSGLLLSQATYAFGAGCPSPQLITAISPLACTASGNFQIGSLGVGGAPDGISGDILASGGIGLGPFSAAAPGAGNIIIDNHLLCNNAANASVDCITANNGLGNFSLISITASNGFQFGSTSAPGLIFATAGTNSVSFIVGTLTALSATSAGITISNGFAGALKLSGGSLLSMTGGTKPTCSSATGTCTTTVGSTDNRGKMTLSGGTAVTTLTLTFNHTWSQPPFCNFVDCNASTSPVAFSTGAINTATAIVDFASTSATVTCYQCF